MNNKEKDFNKKSNFNENEQENLIKETLSDIEEIHKTKEYKKAQHLSIAKKVGIVVGGVCLITAIGLGIQFGVHRYNVNKTVMSIDDGKISNLEYKYFNDSIMDSFYANYSSYFDSWGFDYSGDYTTQYYDEDNKLTWADYFESQTEAAIIECNMMNDESNKENLDYSDLVSKYVETQVNSIEADANSAGLSLNEYLSKTYVKGTTIKDIKTILEKEGTSKYYKEHYIKTTDVTDSEIDDYYEANKKTIDNVDYRIFAFSVIEEINTQSALNSTTAEAKTIVDDNTSDNSKKTTEQSTDSTESKDSTESDNESSTAVTDTQEYKDAQKIALSKATEFYNQVYDEDTFKELCINYSNDTNKQLYSSSDFSLKKNTSYSDVNTVIGDWLFTSGRQEKSTAILYDESTYTYYVVYFVNRYRNENAENNIKGIYIPYETTDSTNFTITDDNKKTSKDKADTIINEWNKSDKTNDTFDDFILTYSKDESALDNSGIYTTTNSVKEITDWGSDTNRKPGDIDIVESEAGVYILYYESNGNQTWYNVVKRNIQEEKYQSHLSETYESKNVTFK